MQPVQAAVHVIKGNRLELPEGSPSWFKSLVGACWAGEASMRPTMMECRDLLNKAIVAVSAQQQPKQGQQEQNE